MTKKQIEKAAKENGIDLSLISIGRHSGTFRFEMADIPKELANRNIAYYEQNMCQLQEVEKMIRKNNREVKKLLMVLGVKYWGLRTGYGAWDYTLGSMDESTRLALNNID